MLIFPFLFIFFVLSLVSSWLLYREANLRKEADYNVLASELKRYGLSLAIKNLGLQDVIEVELAQIKEELLAKLPTDNEE